jgi:hypothetical protein
MASLANNVTKNTADNNVNQFKHGTEILPALPDSDDELDEDEQDIEEEDEDEDEQEDEDEDKDEDEDESADETLTQLSIMAQNIVHANGDMQQAEKLFRGVLAGRQASCGKDHPKSLFAQNNLALFLQQQASYTNPVTAATKLKEAEELLRNALAGYETSRGSDHSETLCCCNNLAQLLYVQEKDLDLIENLFRRALDGNDSQLGADHPSTLASVSNLARVLEDVNKLEEAGMLYERSLASKNDEAAMAEDVLEECNDLAKFFRRQEKYDKALPLCVRACEGRTKVLGALHPDTLASLYGLAAIHIGLSNWKEAKTYAQKSLDGYFHLKLTEDIADGIELISKIFIATGREGEILKLHQQFA